ncbi:MAG: 16S rRNA (guanine(966)-N(2))-methyltransferase RsmD [Endozoicomonadaceae bacterium]|nr:16S rRNA (guanine(966)-N(2))-methyltransferase RsmD [Endozoicomonadaceae bacterium]
MSYHKSIDTQKKTASQGVRIIGGAWKGRRLMMAKNALVRPTLNHMRETLFNWLMPDIHSARCLDAFAGSGALGIEALSRGAKEVVFLEKSKPIFNQLQSNIKALRNISTDQVIRADAVKWLHESIAQPFDIIFLDPPFYTDLLMPLCQAIQQYGWVKAGAFIYLEHEIETSVCLPENWVIYKEKCTARFSAKLCIIS